jgi:hypothetical protein
MTKKKTDTTLENIYVRLIDNSSQSKDYGRQTPLKEFTKIVRLLIDTHTCLLTFVDLNKKRIYKIAASSKDTKFEEHLEKKRIIPLQTSENKNNGVSFGIATDGLEYETFTLQTDGGGISNPDVSKKYNLNYFYCCPIEINGVLRGYVNFFSTDSKGFSANLKQQIKIISKLAEVTV